MFYGDKFNICDQYIVGNADAWKDRPLEDIHVGVLRSGRDSEWRLKFEEIEMDGQQVRHFLVRIRNCFDDQHDKLIGIHDKIREAAHSLSDSDEWKYTLKEIDQSQKISRVIHSIQEVIKTKLQHIPPISQTDIKTKATYIYSPTQTLYSIENTYEDILTECIYTTEGWENKKEIFRLEIDRLLEKSREEDKLIEGKGNWDALNLAAILGDISTLDKLHEIFGDKLPEIINKATTPPLLRAICESQYSFAQALIKAGADVNVRTSEFKPLFHEIVRTRDSKAIEFYLNLNGIDLDCRDEYKNTALHIACHTSDIHLTELLLKNPILAKQIHEKDIFGRTPLDVALQNKSDDIVCSLLKNPLLDPKTLPGYGVELQKIDQFTVLGKLTHFLKLKRRQEEQKLEQDKHNLTAEQLKERTKSLRDPYVITPGGHCNGLSFLFQYYASKGKEKEFYHILDVFARWDGSESSLTSREGLSGLSGDYKDLEDMMEQWINDIIWFQHESLKSSYLPYGQLGRIPQFETLKKHVSDQVSDVKEAHYKFNKEQLAEWLYIQSHFPGQVTEITGSTHAVGLRVLEDRSCLYYDPNIFHPLPPFQSMDQLAEVIQQIKFLTIGQGKDKMDTTSLIYKFRQGPEILDKEPTGKVPEDLKKAKSANGYSLLHLAILFNDQELFEAELKHAASEVNTPNKHGQTPFHDAILYGRKSMVEAIMNLPQWELSKNLAAGDPLKISLKSGYFDIAKSLIEKYQQLEDKHIAALIDSEQKSLLKGVLEKGIDPNLLNSFDFSHGGRALHLAINKRDPELFALLLKHGADITLSGALPVESILSCLASIRDEAFLTSILPMLSNLNTLDVEGSNLLHYAVLKDNAWLVKSLLERGADVSIKNKHGQTALDLAKDSHRDSILSLISQ